MGKKVTFCEVPISAGWERLLKNMEINSSLCFRNTDNTAANGRQAIKRFVKKWPEQKFSTRTRKDDHSFTIVRVR